MKEWLKSETGVIILSSMDGGPYWQGNHGPEKQTHASRAEAVCHEGIFDVLGHHIFVVNRGPGEFSFREQEDEMGCTLVFKTQSSYKKDPVMPSDHIWCEVGSFRVTDDVIFLQEARFTIGEAPILFCPLLAGDYRIDSASEAEKIIWYRFERI